MRATTPASLNYASAGPGGIIHLTTALLASRAGLQMTHVPYKSGAPALNGLLTGEVDVYFGNASELLQQAASGRVRLLAVSSAARLKQLPDMPTIGESYPGFLVTSWNGFLAPAGTPQPIVRLLARETRNAAKDPCDCRSSAQARYRAERRRSGGIRRDHPRRARLLPRGCGRRRNQDGIVRLQQISRLRRSWATPRARPSSPR
jgi:tripartite-type tricarboxylate transporter receptor subunit TctC